MPHCLKCSGMEDLNHPSRCDGCTDNGLFSPSPRAYKLPGGSLCLKCAKLETCTEKDISPIYGFPQVPEFYISQCAGFEGVSLK